MSPSEEIGQKNNAPSAKNNGDDWQNKTFLYPLQKRPLCVAAATRNEQGREKPFASIHWLAWRVTVCLLAYLRISFLQHGAQHGAAGPQ